VKLNRAIAFNYEPGSVMKVVTAAAAIDAGMVRPSTLYRTNRDDSRYYRLPGDGGHTWEPLMSVKDAIVKSSNIVIGKLGWDLGPRRLWEYMRDFGFGARTGIELPGEQYGILWNWTKWDKATWSRAGIGQGVSVTAIQLAGAYQAIANDGVRMCPYIVEKIVSHDGALKYQGAPKVAGRVISAATARTMREMMLGVAAPGGTARRAAIKGFSIAGKTGTAQKSQGKSYAPGLYRATFCGIVPASAPRIVVLVTLDFDERTRYHQGGNSAGPVFKRIAEAALSYLMVSPDRPQELEYED
jgi:cell division protein FtsI (penicillin-binding protein 3)